MPSVLSTKIRLVAWAVAGLWLAGGCADSAQRTREITHADLRDKIRGGWAGQMIGVSYGFPTEFEFKERIIPESELPVWRPEMIHEALHQDDLYVDITFAQVLDEKGLDASTEDFGAFFREAKYPLWHANLAARRALRRGVPATLSGTPFHNIHANDIDFQIEADFIGLMSPGLPQVTNELSYRVGRVMNHGDGIYGGMFTSAMYAAAFFETDPRRVVEQGLAVLPPGSGYAGIITDVLQWSEQHPHDWPRVWHLIHEKWNHGELCPAGALEPFNIDARINGAFVALGLLYGNGDFERTMRIATQAGQDSDCNPATAAGILGVMLGFEAIPGVYTRGLDAIAEETFDFTDYSFNGIVDSTMQRAIAIIERNGGRVEGQRIVVATQEPKKAKLRVGGDLGTAREQIRFDDPRWQWRGDWQHRVMKIWRYEISSNISKTAGSEAEIAFKGTGASIIGLLLPGGGTADVYLDGKHAGTIDVYPDEPNAKFNESIWHRFGLDDEQHQLRLVVRGEAYPGSDGAEISIESLLVLE